MGDETVYALMKTMNSDLQQVQEKLATLMTTSISFMQRNAQLTTRVEQLEAEQKRNLENVSQNNSKNDSLPDPTTFLENFMENFESNSGPIRKRKKFNSGGHNTPSLDNFLPTMPKNPTDIDSLRKIYSVFKNFGPNRFLAKFYVTPKTSTITKVRQSGQHF